MRWMSHRGWALAGGALLVVAAAPVFAAPQGPAQPPSPTPQAAAPATTPPPATQETALRIPASEARQALAQGKAVLVDVRSKEAYEASHALGAISIPLSDLPLRAGELPKDKLVITYCT